MHASDKAVAWGGRRAALALTALAGLAALLVLVALHTGRAAASSMGDRFRQTNLVSDQPGHARLTDPNLVNAWGLSWGPSTPAWVADNGADVSTLYTGDVRGSAPSIVPLVVHIPGGAPTGTVFNGTSGFVIGKGASRGPAFFLFSSEAGKLTAWNPGGGSSPRTRALTMSTVRGAIFKGLTLAQAAHGTHLYATDFHGNRVIVWDSRFHIVHLAGRFVDRRIPHGFAPFNIQRIDGNLFVTYAKQDADRVDDVHGRGLGFVDVYTPNGQLVRRLVSRGALNAPWGLVKAPSGFGRFSGSLLVGNFGDGTIHAYDMHTGRMLGTLMNASGHPLRIDGLWGLKVGNGVIGDAHSVMFSAGPDDESHGLFGSLRAMR